MRRGGKNFKKKIAYNGLRVGDVALCCACGKAILLTRCYGLVNLSERDTLTSLILQISNPYLVYNFRRGSYL